MAYTIAGRPVGRIGFGMIGLTMPGSHPSTEDSIAILKAALNMGATFWNGGEHYGTPEYNSLHLLKAYFERYPEDVDKVVVSVKTCFNIQTRKPQVDAKSVRESIEHCLAIVDGKFRIGVLQAGRLDRNVPVEETVGTIAEYVKAGKIGGVGMSECSGASIRKAVKVTPIAAVEVELSLFETGIFRNGVTEACGEFGVPIVAYSPLSRGILTGIWQKHDDLPEDNIRTKIFPRFQREAFEENMKLVREVEAVAQRKGCTNAQVAIAWVSAQSKKIGTSVVAIPGASSLARVQENMKDVELSQDELLGLDEFLQRIEIKGARYPPQFVDDLEV